MAKVLGERSYPWNREPSQGRHLECGAEAECSLIRRDRIVSILRRPLADDDPDAVLDHECPAEVQEIQSSVGARGKFPGEVIGYDRKAQDGGSASDRHHRPRQK